MDVQRFSAACVGTDAGGSRLSRDTQRPHFWMLMVVLGGPWLSTSWIPVAWMKMGDRGPTLPAFLTDRDVRLELCQLPRGLPLKRKTYLLLVQASPTCSVQHPPGLPVPPPGWRERPPSCSRLYSYRREPGATCQPGALEPEDPGLGSVTYIRPVTRGQSDCWAPCSPLLSGGGVSSSFVAPVLRTPEHLCVCGQPASFPAHS